EERLPAEIRGLDEGVKRLEELVRLRLLASAAAGDPAEGEPACQEGAGEAPPPTASRGSAGHPEACAVPCKFYATKRGCKDGQECSYCHACRWRSCLRHRAPRHQRAPRAAAAPCSPAEQGAG
ncbi:unnamed protein product, partial [Prorocentrum cordatum]